MLTCKRVHYSGRVQGVGFRYTAAGLARGYAVGGYVRNLPNGQVELVVEGDGTEVDRFLQALAQQMAEYIQAQQVDEFTPQGFESFAIRT